MVATALAFAVQVIDGEVIPVPGVEVGARFTYRETSTTWSSAVTDGDGNAHFSDRHLEDPSAVCLYVADTACGTYQVADGCHIVLEM